MLFWYVCKIACSIHYSELKYKIKLSVIIVSFFKEKIVVLIPLLEQKVFWPLNREGLQSYMTELKWRLYVSFSCNVYIVHWESKNGQYTCLRLSRQKVRSYMK